MGFDVSPAQKAFLTGCWVGSLLYTLAVLAWDAATGRKRR